MVADIPKSKDMYADFYIAELLPPKLQRRGLVFLVNWVTMERV